MSKGKNVEDIDFSSHRFLVNDFNNNLFEWMEKGRKGKYRKIRIWGEDEDVRLKLKMKEICTWIYSRFQHFYSSTFVLFLFSRFFLSAFFHHTGAPLDHWIIMNFTRFDGEVVRVRVGIFKRLSLFFPLRAPLPVRKSNFSKKNRNLVIKNEQ